MNVAADHGGVIGTDGEKWPCSSSGTMYCVSGRGIVADGCGSTAAAAKLIANESAAATHDDRAPADVQQRDRRRAE